MTSSAGGTGRILGTLGVADGTGVVTMRDRFSTGIEDLWDAMTNPERLERWLGSFEGELKLGGEYRTRYHSSGWEGTCRVEACEPPRHVRISTSEGGAAEVWLTAEGDGTLLVAEERGMPVDLLWAYGAGIQTHVENLLSYLAGGEPVDAEAMFDALEPAYRKLAAELDE